MRGLNGMFRSFGGNSLSGNADRPLHYGWSEPAIMERFAKRASAASRLFVELRIPMECYCNTL
jgi:hypothetical protein